MNINFFVLLAGLLAFNTSAKEPIHSYPESGFEVYSTENVKAVEVSGKSVRLFMKNSEVLATIFVFKDLKNTYPLLEEFSEKFFTQVYTRYDHKVFSQSQGQRQLSSRSTDSVEYLVDLKGIGCELYLASAIGNRSYSFINISNEATKSPCKNDKDTLKVILSQLVESIKISDI